MSTTFSPFQLDLNGFTIGNQLFYPKVAKSPEVFDETFHNTVMIPVDLTLNADLSFEEEKKLAQFYQERGVRILFELKFGFFQYRVKLHMDQFEGFFARALQLFMEGLYKGLEGCVLGVILYKGDVDLSKVFLENEYYYQETIDFLKSIYKTPSYLFESNTTEIDTFEKLHPEMLNVSDFTLHLKNLYYHSFFAEYLHRLAAELPDELLAFAYYDCKSISNQSFLSQVLSKNRYPHIHLILENSKVPRGDIVDAMSIGGLGLIGDKSLSFDFSKPAKVGLVFADDVNLLQSAHLHFNEVINELWENEVHYRIIPENLVTESWQGLDELIFLNSSLSQNGKRILQGFSITGGRLSYLDEPINLENERSFDDFLKGSG